MPTTPRLRHVAAAGIGVAALSVFGLSCSSDSKDTTTTTKAPGASSTTAGTQTGGGSGSTSGGSGSGSSGSGSDAGSTGGDPMTSEPATTGTMLPPPVNGGGSRPDDSGVNDVGGVVTAPPTPTVTVRPGALDPNAAGGAATNGN